MTVMQGEHLLVLSSSRDARAADLIAQQLKPAGLEIRVDVVESAAEDPNLVRSAGAIALLVGPTRDTTPFRRVADAIAPGQAAFLVLLKGAPPAAVDELARAFPGDAVIDLTHGPNEAVLADLARRVRAGPLGYAASEPPPDEASEKPAPMSEAQTSAPEEWGSSDSPVQAPPKQAPPRSSPSRRSAATKTAPPPPAAAPPPAGSDEAEGPSRRLDPVVFERMSPSSKRVLAEAKRLSQLSGSTRIHMDHLLVGLYRKSGGPMQRLLGGVQPPMSADELAGLLEDVVEAVVPSDGAVPQPLSAPPRLSGHVRQAVDEAVKVADDHPLPDGLGRSIQSRHLLYGALSVADCAPIKALLERGIRKENIDLAELPPAPDDTAAIAGFKSDEAKGDDLLDIRREVEALAKVIAAKDVEPPLAIGLFGDWGTGKTFFMRQMKERIEQIATAERDRSDKGPQVYHTKIVQLDFNAWHYIEQDLWASLASAIFEGLDDALTRQNVTIKKQRETDLERAQLLTNRAKALQALELAENEKAQADANLAAAGTRLERLDTMYDEKGRSIRPREIVSRAVTAAVADPVVALHVDEVSRRVNRTVEAAAAQIGVKPDDLRVEFARSGSLRAWVAGATRQLLRGSRRWLPIAAAALVALVAVTVAGLLTAGSEIVTPIAGAIGLAVGALTPSAYAAARVWNVIRVARAEGLKEIDQEREEKRAALVAEQEREAARSLEAAGRAARARTQLNEADRGLEASKPKRMLANFVSGRRASADYRARLGVVAQARGDFEQLSNLLQQAQGEGSNGTGPAPAAAGGPNTSVVEKDEFLPTIERIVLYIDDLDRCHEKDVVAVLQAVNLLMAFPLFVVIVAVDPRWLVHSLRVESRAFEGARGRNRSGEDFTDTEAEAEWQATPLNYLEKIFQVPFAIKPMGKRGFEAMIQDLVKPGETSQTENESTEQEFPGPEDPAQDEVTPRASTLHPGPVEPQEQTRELNRVPAPQPPPPTPAPKVDLDRGFLRITETEQGFMALLHPLITTPRAAKRFVNVYRILKASAPTDRRKAMGRSEEYRPILLLLAMLTGHPTETTVVLRTLIEDGPTGDWWALVEGVIKGATAKEAKTVDSRLRADRWKLLGDRLEQVKPQYGAADCAAFVYWARDVARFSFESSRVLLGQPERPVGRHAGAPHEPAAVEPGSAV